MTCGGEISRLDTSGGGSISSLEDDCPGDLIRLECCPTVETQQQELARHWKINRKDLISTLPIPFGVASFGTVSMGMISGPPKPGDTTRLSNTGITIEPPSGPTRPPDSTPIPPGTSFD